VPAEDDPTRGANALPLKAVQKLLGHSSIQTTGNIYADWDIDQLATDAGRRPRWRGRI